MAAVLTVTSANIKDYLVITSTTYDTQIAVILGLWDYTIEDMIQPGYLASTALTNILTLGKLLVIAGQVKSALPATATGSATGTRTTIKMADYEETVENKAQSGSVTSTVVSGDGLIKQGWDMLKPYLTAAATAEGLNQFKSSTSDYAAEASLTRRDANGTVISIGTLEGW